MQLPPLGAFGSAAEPPPEAPLPLEQPMAASETATANAVAVTTRLGFMGVFLWPASVVAAGRVSCYADPFAVLPRVRRNQNQSPVSTGWTTPSRSQNRRFPSLARPSMESTAGLMATISPPPLSA